MKGERNRGKISSEWTRREDIPFFGCILFIPVVNMLEFIMRIIFKSNRTCRRPLRMFLRNALLCDTLHPQFLPFSQLAYNTAQPSRVRNDWRPHPLIGSRFGHNQIPCIHLHNLVTSTSGMKSQSNTAVLAILLTLAVTGIDDVFDLLGVEGYEAEAMCNELIG